MWLFFFGTPCTYLLYLLYVDVDTSEGTKETGRKGEKIDFQILCHQRCRNLEIQVTHTAGDVDLYGQEDDIPHLVSVSQTSNIKTNIIGFFLFSV